MRSLTLPDGGTVNVLDRLVVRCILQEPEMMPHAPVPTENSASITAGEGTRTQGTRVSVPALAR